MVVIGKDKKEKMKYCHFCGDALREKSRYCKNCGAFLKTPDEFSVEEESGKFCQTCGSSTVKQYCPQCGTYAKDVSIKVKSKVRIVDGPDAFGNNRSLKELFASVFSAKEDWKTTLLNAGVFAVMLTFLLGVIVFLANAGIVNNVD